MPSVLPSLLLLWMQTSPAALPHLKTCSDNLKLRDAAGAVKACKTAVGLDPQSAAAHFLLGQAYLAMNSASMVAEAKAEFQQALDLDETIVWARLPPSLSKSPVAARRPTCLTRNVGRSTGPCSFSRGISASRPRILATAR